MFVYKSQFLTRGEVWFEAEPDERRVDWICYSQRPQPLPGSRWQPFFTRLIDLSKNPAELLAEMDPKRVRAIKEAEKQIQWERCAPQGAAALDEVEELWNRFAAAQGDPLLDRPWLEPLAAAGALELSTVRDQQGNLLTYNVALVTPRRVRQLLAVTRRHAAPSVVQRQTINRAHSLAVWKTLQTHQERGVRQFDFGGWYPGTADMRLLGINAFKKSFGGEVVREYCCEQIVTLKAWVVLTAARILACARPRGTNLTTAQRETSNAVQTDSKISAAV